MITSGNSSTPVQHRNAAGRLKIPSADWQAEPAPEILSIIRVQHNLSPQLQRDPFWAPIAALTEINGKTITEFTGWESGPDSQTARAESLVAELLEFIQEGMATNSTIPAAPVTAQNSLSKGAGSVYKYKSKREKEL